MLAARQRDLNAPHNRPPASWQLHYACETGVTRTHILDARINGAMLLRHSPATV